MTRIYAITFPKAKELEEYLILLEGKLELFMTECILKVTTQFFGMGMMIMEFQFLKALIFVHYLQMTLQ
jgi:hypothetical protein